jgi:Domain of Unknown Function (DUF928)
MKLKQIGIIILSTTLVLSNLGPVAFFQASAGTPTRKLNQKKAFRFIPSGIGAPNNRSAAGLRSSCKSVLPNTTQNIIERNFIALVSEKELGLTIDETPAIAFYIPPICVEAMRFKLVDTITNQTYESLLAPPASSGIIHLKLSSLKDLPPIEVGKKYQWVLMLVTDSGDVSGNMEVNGFLQRKALNTPLTQALKMANLGDRPSLYASHSLWFETVTALIEARRSRPQDAGIKADWDSLMASVGLDAIASQPLVSNFVAKVNSQLPKQGETLNYQTACSHVIKRNSAQRSDCVRARWRN